MPRIIRNIAACIDRHPGMNVRQLNGVATRYIKAHNMARLTRDAMWAVRAQAASDELEEFLAHAERQQ